MTFAEAEARLNEELSIARLMAAADPSSVERRSELDRAVRRYTGLILDGKIPEDMVEGKLTAHSA